MNNMARASLKKTAATDAPNKAHLKKSLDDIQKAIEALPAEYDYIFKPSRHLFFTFLRGMAQALGALTVVVIVVPLVIWALSKIEWVPTVGDFVRQVRDRVEQTQNTMRQ
ncbi:MAG: hypothetical protein JWM56_575 [Candidatus Peribacteria bacterium]|nr:hypothetical protein [Candidatus Peribacteria bacterium]